jgi:glutaredoxin
LAGLKLSAQITNVHRNQIAITFGQIFVPEVFLNQGNSSVPFINSPYLILNNFVGIGFDSFIEFIAETND